MDRAKLPSISLKAKPDGLRLRAPDSAVARWEKDIESAAKPDPSQVEIVILTEIGEEMWGGFSAAMMKDQLDRAGDAPVLVTLNSPGGDAFEGVAIFNLLRNHRGKVTVNIIGIAASAASVIAMAGDRIEMQPGTMMMIHSAWGLVVGNQQDLRDFAEILDKLDQSVATLYAARTGKSKADVLELMRKETWMTAKEAKDDGFCDVAHAEKKDKQSRASLHAAPLPTADQGSRPRAGVQLSASRPAGLPASKPTPKGTMMKKPIAEQIAALEARRQANSARREEIQMKAIDDGRAKDAGEKAEFDTLTGEIETIDSELVDLRMMERQAVAAAKPAPAAPSSPADPTPRSGIISVAQNVEPGIAMTRYVKALVVAKGNPAGALAYAQANQRWRDQTPEVAQVLMAAVAAGDTTTAGWAAELVYNQNLASAFLEYLRPRTIIGRIPGFTRVPFNVRWGTQTAGATGYWVGEGKPIPVSKFTVGSGSLGIAKAAGLIVLTKELIMSSDPSAEMMTRDELAKCITQFLDQQFIAPDYAAVANVSPASITNDVVPTAASGTALSNLRTDVQTLFNIWNEANVDPSSGVWVTTPRIALALSMMQNALGQNEFPTVTINGGTLYGLPLIVSNSAKQVGSPVTGEGNLLVLLSATDIALADEGGITIDASGEAAIQMLDNPTNATTAGTTATTMVSMFQTDSVALRGIRFINWVKRRTTAVQYIKDAAYVA